MLTRWKYFSIAGVSVIKLGSCIAGGTGDTVNYYEPSVFEEVEVFNTGHLVIPHQKQ